MNDTHYSPFSLDAKETVYTLCGLRAGLYTTVSFLDVRFADETEERFLGLRPKHHRQGETSGGITCTACVLLKFAEAYV